MTIEKRPNATADKNAPTQAPERAPIAAPAAGGPKLPGPPGVPGTERFRLLAYVKQESMVRVDKRPDETVLTWPHLLRAEFVMAMLITVLLTVTAVFISAPLEEMANPSVTPHVAKAPWYFLGLQELLSYFNPTVAGVLVIPVYIGGLLIIPFVDRTPYKAARDRKLMWVFFLCLMIGGLIVTFIGSFFRGPGWNWVWPWEGIFFTL
ncbi:MAG TPA: menaquinol-cytochrome c reductase cytochrome b subunit [Candidatus Limnocylindria bacterium]|jgi:quinol-cytochrome oxidoreductase complex cytochrome b subunit|nr:menaquinol-cytochrome c reductase cytochrome b subunit [Candidatus Limnocylindria bacterium]